jgi:hypothetical protein
MSAMEGSMSRRAIAAVCSTCSILVLLVGCGGSSSKVDTTSAKGLCPSVSSALKEYTAAATAMSIQFSNKKLVHRTLQTAEALSPRVVELERVSVGRDKRQLAPLTQALASQQKVLAAVERGNFAEARKYGGGIDIPLAKGLKDLRAICAHAT